MQILKKESSKNKQIYKPKISKENIIETFNIGKNYEFIANRVVLLTPVKEKLNIIRIQEMLKSMKNVIIVKIRI